MGYDNIQNGKKSTLVDRDKTALVDRFGRAITYLRLSVTDRCDLRCSYCMAEHMTFLPKKDVLSLEELTQLADAFIDRGVRKIRLTGGEPLVRRDVMQLVDGIARHLGNGLDELTLTTNAMQLDRYAAPLADAGVRRINVSLDTLDPVAFERLTKRNTFSQVMRGIEAARKAGLAVKINTVALKGVNEHEIASLIRFAHGGGMDITLIEVMPLGEIETARIDQYLPLTKVLDDLQARWTLNANDKKTGGPARYYTIAETGGDLGVITPLTNNFCAGCNRVRVTCTGRIYMCLGHEDHLDLRAALRQGGRAALDGLLNQAMGTKPERHFFDIGEGQAESAVARHMSVTGG